MNLHFEIIPNKILTSKPFTSQPYNFSHFPLAFRNFVFKNKNKAKSLISYLLCCCSEGMSCNLEV